MESLRWCHTFTIRNLTEKTKTLPIPALKDALMRFNDAPSRFRVHCQYRIFIFGIILKTNKHFNDLSCFLKQKTSNGKSTFAFSNDVYAGAFLRQCIYTNVGWPNRPDIRIFCVALWWISAIYLRTFQFFNDYFLRY
jgi:hypothetical protein